MAKTYSYKFTFGEPQAFVIPYFPTLTIGESPQGGTVSSYVLLSVLTKFGKLPAASPLHVGYVRAVPAMDAKDRPTVEVEFNASTPHRLGSHAGLPEGSYPLMWRDKHRCEVVFATEGHRHYPTITLLIPADTEDAAKAVLADILTEVYLFQQEARICNDRGNVVTYIARTDEDSMFWERGSSRRKRNPTTLYLPDKIKAALFKELEAFEAEEEDYETYGVPHKKVVLLSGPPGTGKTSTVWVAASHFGKAIATLTASPKMTNEHLATLLRDLPNSTAYLLIEEIDCLFHGRDGTAEAGSVTFSQLLTALDGMNTPEGIVIFLTTNHRERLTDEAFNRAGRIDHEYVFDYMQPAQIATALSVLAKASTEEDRAAFLAATAHLRFTMSTLQEYLFRRRKSPELLVKDVPEFCTLVDKYHTKPPFAKLDEEGAGGEVEAKAKAKEGSGGGAGGKKRPARLFPRSQHIVEYEEF